MAESTNDSNVYVAVSKDVGECEPTLLWALRNLPVKKLFLLYVHQQTPMNPTSSGLEQSEISAIQQSDLNSSYESLYKYRDICEAKGVIKNDIDVDLIKADNVGEGIVELIYDNNIKKLVMGAAADSHYTEGMDTITSKKAKYVSRHAPHCCKIWFVCNGNLIQTSEGRFDLAGSSHSSSESLASLHDLDSALVPYEGLGKAEHGTGSDAPSSSEDRLASEFETRYYEEQRRLLEIEELKREKEQREKEEALSSSFGVTQILYNDEVRRRRKAEEELNKAKEEIENMKMVQKELQDQLYVEYPRLVELFEKQRDEAINANEDLLRRLKIEEGDSSSHSSSSPLQWFVSHEPPPYFLCPITREIMRNPHVAADGYTYEAEEFKTWLSHGTGKSPMTNLRLEHHNLTPNLILRTAINDWLQQNR